MGSLPLPSGDVFDVHSLADWLEVSTFISSDVSTSPADLEGAFRKAALAEADSQEKIEDIVLNVLSEINSRSRDAGLSYPFEVDDHGVVSLKNGWGRYAPYIFCLFVSYIDHDKSGTGPHLFEKLSTTAARCYLSGEGVKFGHPRTELPSSFDEATDILASKIGEGKGFSQQSTEHVRDGKVDVVAWKDFCDGRPSKLIIFGQCSTGDNWNRKFDMRPSYFFQQWMKESIISPSPVRSLFIPHRVDNDRWNEISRQAGILFDRCRISSCAFNSDQTFYPLVKWINENTITKIDSKIKMRYSSPLRYPGGKSRLANFMKLVFIENELIGEEYVEPYAGGAGIGLFLVIEEYVDRIHLNDLDRSIYAFWHAVTKNPSDLCARIKQTDATVSEWKNQREKQKLLRNKTGLDKSDLLDLGFSTFFLNRTNRSGIVRGGGVIGGIEQEGKWGVKSRYNKKSLLKRIRRIANHRDKISIYNWSASKFLRHKIPNLPSESLIYLDPPYYESGQNLYQNEYTLEKHQEVAELVSNLDKNWIVSYDNSESIRKIYDDYEPITYDLSYSARRRYEGAEVMFVSDGLDLPEFDNPARISKERVQTRWKNYHQGTLVNDA